MNGDDTRRQLELAMQARASHDQALWTSFSIFTGAQTVLLVALLPNGAFVPGPEGIAVTITGGAIAVVWSLLGRRAIGNVKRLTALIQTLEEDLKVPRSRSISAHRNRELTQKHLPRGPEALFVMEWTPLIAILAWFATALVSLAVVVWSAAD